MVNIEFTSGGEGRPVTNISCRLALGLLFAFTFVAHASAIGPDEDVDPNEVLFRLSAPESSLEAGDKAEISLDISAPLAFQGFQTSMAYDTEAINVGGWNIRNEHVIDSLGGADFVSFSVNHEIGSLTVGVLLRTAPPFDVASIPGVGCPMPMMNIEVSVPEDVPTQITRFRFVNGFGVPPKFNLLVVGNQGEAPDRTKDALISVTAGVPFLRGDSDQDGQLSMNDTVRVLTYLFIGGSLDCEKAADKDDSARTDMNDAIGLLRYLFLNGVEPMPPFPLPGRDPTDDDLTCLTSYFAS